MIRRCMTLLLVEACATALSFSLNSTRISLVCDQMDDDFMFVTPAIAAATFTFNFCSSIDTRSWIASSELRVFEFTTCSKNLAENAQNVRLFCTARCFWDQMLENTVLRSVTILEKFMIVEILWVLPSNLNETKMSRLCMCMFGEMNCRK